MPYSYHSRQHSWPSYQMLKCVPGSVEEGDGVGQESDVLAVLDKMIRLLVKGLMGCTDLL